MAAELTGIPAGHVSLSWQDLQGMSMHVEIWEAQASVNCDYDANSTPPLFRPSFSQRRNLSHEPEWVLKWAWSLLDYNSNIVCQIPFAIPPFAVVSDDWEWDGALETPYGSVSQGSRIPFAGESARRSPVTTSMAQSELNTQLWLVPDSPTWWTHSCLSLLSACSSVYLGVHQVYKARFFGISFTKPFHKNWTSFQF